MSHHADNISDSKYEGISKEELKLLNDDIDVVSSDWHSVSNTGQQLATFTDRNQGSYTLVQA